jgi:hypothetical protein
MHPVLIKASGEGIQPGESGGVSGVNSVTLDSKSSSIVSSDFAEEFTAADTHAFIRRLKRKRVGGWGLSVSVDEGIAGDVVLAKPSNLGE